MRDGTEGAALGVADGLHDAVDGDVDRIGESEDLQQALGKSPKISIQKKWEEAEGEGDRPRGCRGAGTCRWI